MIDETNYLVDLSGRYSLCLISTRQQSGELTIKETTPEGRHIDGLSDYVEGPNTDSDSLTAYIDGALKRWVREEPFRSTVNNSVFLHMVVFFLDDVCFYSNTEIVFWNLSTTQCSLSRCLIHIIVIYILPATGFNSISLSDCIISIK